MEKQPAEKVSKPSNSKKLRLGEILIQKGRISERQLHQVLQRQAQTGEHIGSVLIELGFVTVDELLDVLGEKLGAPGLNLYNVNIDPEVIKLIPSDQIISQNILPVAADNGTLTLAMVDPQNLDMIGDLEFKLSRKISPRVVPIFMMDAALKLLAARPEKGIKGEELAKMAKHSKEFEKKAPRLIALLRSLAKTNASDLFLTPGAPPSLKINNEVKRLPIESLKPADCETYARELMTAENWETFVQQKDIEFAVTYPEIARFRVTAYSQRGSVSLTIRSLPEVMSTLEKLNLPEWINEIVLKPRGLILVTGLSGHGKTTTLNAMVNIINSNRRCNIVTLEDPIEYLHKHKKSNINQREIGRDVKSFSEGLRNVFKQAPDVIVVGDLRDRESVEIALRAATTGYLVLATVNSDNSTSILEQMIEMFEPDRQSLIRGMLADALLLSLSQRLIKLKSGQGRILAHEKLTTSPRIKKIMREEKTHLIRSQLQVGSKDFTAIDISIANLCKEGTISFEDGLMYANDEQFYRGLVPENLRKA